MRQGPLREVLRVFEQGPGGTMRFALELSCGHKVGRRLVRLGYNRKGRDQAHCQRCAIEKEAAKR